MKLCGICQTTTIEDGLEICYICKVGIKMMGELDELARKLDKETVIKIPTFEQAKKQLEAAEDTPLDAFVYHNEPADDMETEIFRKQLQALIDYVTQEVVIKGE